jgi:N-acyl-D-amino-acid deacylase
MNYTLLRGGALIDGTGAEPRSGSLLFDERQIVAVGEIAPPDDCEIVDCEGLAIAPGFIDLHSHSDLQVLENRPEKSLQGVTTEVVGNCGFSPYPCGAHGDALREFSNGIFRGSSAWAYPDVRDYLAELESHSQLVSVRSLIGHGSLRIGLFGNHQNLLTQTELDRMNGVLDDALSAGACGLSTGLMYAPGSSAGTEELEALCRAVARRGSLYATHMRNYSFRLVEAVEEQLNLARASGCRLQISHLQAAGRANWDKQRIALDRIEAARKEGIDVEFDIYPYQAGSTVLTQFLPQWTLNGGNASLVKLLLRKEERPRIAAEALQQIAQQWSDILITSVESAANQPLVGMTIEAISAQRGTDPMETIMDLIVEEHGQVNIVSFNQSEQNLRELLTHPLCSVISDGFYVKGRPHPRLHGTFPTLLGEISRNRKWMPLAEAVHKITAKPAARLGIANRGVLKPGAIADVTVFDPKSVDGPATYDSPELSPCGIHAVYRWGKRLGISTGGSYN